jgi:hypothetical protein
MTSILYFDLSVDLHSHIRRVKGNERNIKMCAYRKLKIRKKMSPEKIYRIHIEFQAKRNTPGFDKKQEHGS